MKLYLLTYFKICIFLLCSCCFNDDHRVHKQGIILLSLSVLHQGKHIAQTFDNGSVLVLIIGLTQGHYVWIPAFIGASQLGEGGGGGAIGPGPSVFF